MYFKKHQTQSPCSEFIPEKIQNVRPSDPNAGPLQYSHVELLSQMLHQFIGEGLARGCSGGGSVSNNGHSTTHFHHSSHSTALTKMKSHYGTAQHKYTHV